MLRGQRVFCSNRGRRTGCGRTFSVYLDTTIPRHSSTAPQLWAVLTLLCQSPDQSINACAQQARWPLSIQALYALLRRMRLHLDRLRTGLYAIGPPPRLSSHHDPLFAAVEHLKMLFHDKPCPLAAFSLHCKRCWLN